MATEEEEATSMSEKHEELMTKMEKARKEWVGEEEDDTDRLLNQAIEMSLQQGKGWASGEKEEYMKTILDDDFIPPIFASSHEELEKSGLAEAFSTLAYEGEPPARLMVQFKQKGNDAFMNGKRNQAKNVQFYRDAINHYYEAFAWAQKVEPIEDGDQAKADMDDELVYSEVALDAMKSTLCANAAMAHMQLKNWGYVRDESVKALAFNEKNIKAWYRLAKAHQMLQNWEEAGDAIDSGLGMDPANQELKKLQKLLQEKVRKARLARQQRERKRAERAARVKEVWKWCKESSIRLGRVSLVASVTDDEEGDDDEAEESRWHHHHPFSGKIPERLAGGEWAWPCMFLYPSHKQSDFIEHFYESEMIGMRMAMMFPELEDGETETSVPWDYNNEFVSSNLAVYFEVHVAQNRNVVHPDSVELLKDQPSTMRFYEASRALKGDEGPDMANVARALERKHLHKQRKAWKKVHGSLWAKPDPSPVVRVHPAAILRQVLTDQNMIVPNFLVTFLLFPMDHPAHEAYLKEHKCLEVLQPLPMKS